MKKLAFLIMLIITIWGVHLTNAQEDIPTSVYTALDHLNEYLLVPMNLSEQGITWDWVVVTLNDFGENCREREDTSAPLPDVAYDIHFYRLDEAYHYRISMDEQLVVPCIVPSDVPADTLPALVDALDDLNRRFHVGLTLNDLPWRWQETQFEDYTLGCPQLTPPEEDFDMSMDGYIIEFTLLGQQWEYRVSKDRLIVILCESDES